MKSFEKVRHLLTETPTTVGQRHSGKR
jgi:hypothetical protein